MKFDNNNKRQWGWKHLVLILFTVSLASLVSMFVYASQVKKVEINNKGTKIVVKTMGKTVGDVLKENEIELDKDDIVKPDPDSLVGPLCAIDISDSVSSVAKVESSTDASADGYLVKLSEDVVRGYSLQNIIEEDKNNTIEKIEVEKSKVPYEVERKANSKLGRGETRVVKEGKNGTVKKSYRVVYRDGEEVSRTLISKEVVAEPVSKVVEYGTSSILVTSRGDKLRYKKCIVMSATAYDNSYESTGKHPGHPEYGITASGIRTRKGIVAVDPRVIKLGTRLYVESLDGKVPDYGLSLAADTGGAIKGNKVDLYFETKEQVDFWGRRPVKVYVLE
ncbi:3D domain-containing protein [Lutispora sp.]|uniref:3D domain-containing protein n=1 Tax=Lutispora sp. TaxID=2828727 RepID=UPI0035651ECE